MNPPSSLEICENGEAANPSEKYDTTVPTIVGGSYDNEYKIFSPDIIAEAQKEDNRTYIDELTMKGDEKLQNDKDEPLISLKKSSTIPVIPQVDDSNFVKEFIIHHNEYRAKHNVPPLELNTELSKFSQAWAESLAKRNVMENSTSCLGENIFYKSSFELDPREPVDCWYEEGIDYPYGTAEFQLKTGHFTQLVWKESRELGVGIARNLTTGTYIVAHYYPPGNIQGIFPLNILPPFK